jgi:fumarylacetoacetate (FAA) hydrolase
MKLATLKDGSRDGQLAVVSRDLSQAHFAAGIATTLRHALDDWNFIAPQLQELSTTLDHGRARHAFAFDPAMAMAPLPRGGLCAVGVPGDGAPAFWPADPLAGPAEPLRLPASADGDDTALWWAPGLAALCGDVERGTAADAAADAVRLVMASAAVLAGNPAGPAPAQPLALMCSAVALTPDELGAAWTGAGLFWRLDAEPSQPLPAPPAAPLARAIAALAQGRALRAGALVAWRLPLPGEAGDAALPGARVLDPAAPSRLVVLDGPAGLDPFGALSLRVLPAAAARPA